MIKYSSIFIDRTSLLLIIYKYIPLGNFIWLQLSVKESQNLFHNRRKFGEPVNILPPLSAKERPTNKDAKKSALPKENKTVPQLPLR